MNKLTNSKTRRTMKKVLAVMITLAIICSNYYIAPAQVEAAGYNWVEVGKDSFPRNYTSENSIAIDGNGTLFVAYSDQSKLSKISVMKFNGNTWEFVGSQGFSKGGANDIQLAIDGNGTPYVAYKDDANNFNITVKKYDGTNWVTVGSESFAKPMVTSISLTIDSKGTPYVSFYNNSDYIILKKFTGTDWEEIGAGTKTSVSSDNSMVVDQKGVPYVAIVEWRNGSKITVERCTTDNTNRETVGEACFSSGKVTSPSIAMDQTGTPYVAYDDGGFSGKAVVKKYDGTDWVAVGTEGFSIGKVSYVSMAMDGSGTPYVVYSDEGISGRIIVKKFDGTDWVTIGQEGISKGEAIFNSLALDSNGQPYIGYCDFGNNQCLTVKKCVLDTTAPVLTAVAVMRTSDTTGIVRFTSSEAGTYYYEVVADNAAEPNIETSGAGIACTTTMTMIVDPIGLTAGAKDIYIKVKDAAGNVSEALKLDLEAYTSPDTTAPVLTAGEVVRTSDTSGTVKFTSSEAGTYYYEVVADNAAEPNIKTSGGGIACTTAETTITDPIGLTAGAKDIYIKVKDAAGNVSMKLKIDIAAYGSPDTTAPELTAGVVERTSDTTGTVKFTTNEAGEYNYAIVEDGAAMPVIAVSGAAIACTAGEISIIDPAGLSAGAKDIYIKVKDAAGNVSMALKIDITAYGAPDTTAPILTVGVVERTSDTTGTVKFTTNEAGEYNYAIVEDGAAVPAIAVSGAAIACIAGEITITNPAGLSAGAKDIYIKVKDAAGNVSAALKIDIPAYYTSYYTEPSSQANNTDTSKKVRKGNINEINETNTNTVAAVEIVREIIDHKKIDTVRLDQVLAEEILQKAVQQDWKSVQIVIDDITDDKADEVAVTINKDSVKRLSDKKVALEIKTEDVSIHIPEQTLLTASGEAQDLYFRIKPVRDAKEKEEVLQNAITAAIVKDTVGNSKVEPLGMPMIIETNMTKLVTKVMFSLSNITIPSDEVLRKEFLDSLAVYINHSDGEKELCYGTIVYDSNRQPIGLQIEISKFSTFTIVSIKNNAPKAYLKITGKAQAGKKLTAAYTYNDEEDDEQGNSVIQWYWADNKKGKNKVRIEGATSSSYKATKMDQGKYIICEVIPVAKTGVTTGAAISASVKVAVINASKASSVKVKGTMTVGSTLTASYTYKNSESNKEGKSIYLWYRSDNAKGSNKQEIEGEDKLTYTLTEKDLGKYITFEVIPVAAKGNIKGSTAYYTTKSAVKKAELKKAEVQYLSHIKIGVIGSKAYAEKIAGLFKENYDSENVAVKQEGKYYRVYADFVNKAAAIEACEELVSKNYIINYYFYH